MRFLLWLAVLPSFFVTSALAQRVGFSSNSLSFGTITEATLAPSQTLTLTNPSAIGLQIDSVRTFTVYGSGAGSVGKAVSVSTTGSFQVPAAGSLAIPISLKASHNINYNSPIMVCGTGIPGCRAVNLDATVQYRKGYYSTTQNLWGQELFTALKNRITANYNGGSYTTARDAMFLTIDNKKTNGQGATINTLEDVYAGRITTGYTTRVDAQNDNFNTEHTFPQAFFNSATPMVSDLHHLFPTDNDANNRRNNFPFDTVTSAPSYSVGGSKLGTNNGKTVFEPRAQQKGRTARAMCYFVVRHQDYSNFFAPQEQVLRRWAQAYPPDTIDLKRNADVQAFQGNRNPFSDYPQFLDRMPSLANPNQAFPTVTQLSVYPKEATLAQGDTTGFFVTLVNEGNTAIPLTIPAPPAGLEIQPSTLPTSLGVGKAFTFRLLPGTAQQGTQNYTVASGTTLSVAIAGPLQTKKITEGPLLITPNPAVAQVQINSAGTVQISDMLGRIIYTGTAGTISLTSWPTGIYLVKSKDRIGRLVVQ